MGNIFIEGIHEMCLLLFTLAKIVILQDIFLKYVMEEL